MPEPSEYLADRPDVRDARPWSAFAHVARRLDELVSDLTAATDFEGGTVVDYGCADSPYLHLFRGATYVGVDLVGNPGATVTLRPDGTVPLDDASADLVLSTQVLEHVADPDLYLRECARLLRPGGQLVLTTHGIMHLHRDPTDYWRWTSDGLTRIVDRAGLDVVEVRGVLGLVGAALQLLQAGLGSAAPKILRRPIVVVFQALIRLADRATSESSRRENGLVLAVRAVKASR